MNKLKIDEEKNKSENSFGTCNYKYEFRCGVFGLEDGAREHEVMHGLENMHGFNVDARGPLFEALLKDFVVSLRKNIFYENYEELYTTDIKKLIKPQPL